VNGSLVLIYTILVAIPLVWAGTQIVKTFTSDEKPEAPASDAEA
jgi:hypothetical protein